MPITLSFCVLSTIALVKAVLAPRPGERDHSRGWNSRWYTSTFASPNAAIASSSEYPTHAYSMGVKTVVHTFL
jgi:hypothetical protein